MLTRIALLVVALVVVGCSVAAVPSAVPSTSIGIAAPSGRPDASASLEPGAIDLPASITDPVVAEIARIAGVPVDQVVVVSAESVEFPDGSLGCPQPGMAYTQMVVRGYKIVAKVGGDVYDYRGTGSSFRRCVNRAG